MIRPFTVICVLLAGASGMYLYTEKHRTTVLDQQISKIFQDTQHIRAQTAMLRTDWASLNQPERLQALAARFLPHLRASAPTQFVQLADLAQHLPQIEQPTPGAAPTLPDSAARDAAMAANGGQAQVPPLQATVLQAMARRLVPATDDLPAQKHQLASASRAHPVQDALQNAARVATAAPTPTVRHFGRAAHTPLRDANLWRSQPQAAQQTAPATRMASYVAPYRGALPSLLGTSAYARGRPSQVSSLGFAHAAMAAPVPAQDGN